MLSVVVLAGELVLSVSPRPPRGIYPHEVERMQALMSDAVSRAGHSLTWKRRGIEIVLSADAVFADTDTLIGFRQTTRQVDVYVGRLVTEAPGDALPWALARVALHEALHAIGCKHTVKGIMKPALDLTDDEAYRPVWTKAELNGIAACLAARDKEDAGRE